MAMGGVEPPSSRYEQEILTVELHCHVFKFIRIKINVLNLLKTSGLGN